jgi:hypothetical protein
VPIAVSMIPAAYSQGSTIPDSRKNWPGLASL